jgi:two-component system, chemotaxis family, sensor kinase Cph1
MDSSEQVDPKEEIERLRTALDAERQRCLDVQRQANAEFEEFVSLAAHNLREFLRDVASFSQLMAETHAGRLDGDAVMYLARIREGAAGAQALLTEVVDFWATSIDDREVTRTEMDAVLRQALLSTDRQITERSAIVTHDSLPAVMGDFDLLTKTLHHLIRNAIEYCDTAPPRIHISAKRVDLDWELSVQDNGPGIDPVFRKGIFGAFKRLHGKEHPGNGLGLSFSKKVIEAHGGRIWMESMPGEGSTFHFTLHPAD